MGNSKKPSARTKSGTAAIIAPTKTLAETESTVLVGSLVWGKLDGYPWWPGLVVTTTDVGWPISKNEDPNQKVHCILWLGPNKTASSISANKLSDFLDPNLDKLVNQLNEDDYMEAICEASRGLLSQEKLKESELVNIQANELKSLAVQMLTQREEIDGRKHVVLEPRSIWFKRVVESLRYSNKSLLVIAPHEKIEPPSLSSTSKSQKRVSVVNPPSTSNKEESSSSTPQIGPKDSAISVEEEQYPPKKKRKFSVSLPQNEQLADENIRKRFTEFQPDKASMSPLSRNVARKHTNPIMRTAHLKGVVSPPSAPPDTSSATAAKPSNKQGEFIKLEVDGAVMMQTFLKDERFRSLELQKLIEEEERKHVIDLNIRTLGHQKVQLVSWIRFRSLYRSGKIQIRCSKTRPITLFITEPTDIFDSNSLDIESMKDETVLPDAVEKLLALLQDSSEDSGLYAFLHCDGVSWKFIGCFNAGFYAPPPSQPVEEATNSAFPAPSSSGVKNKRPRNKDEQNILPKVIHVERQLPFPTVSVPDAAIVDNPSKEAIVKATKELQNQLGERIRTLDMKLRNIV